MVPQVSPSIGGGSMRINLLGTPSHVRKKQLLPLFSTSYCSPSLALEKLSSLAREEQGRKQQPGSCSQAALSNQRSGCRLTPTHSFPGKRKRLQHGGLSTWCRLAQRGAFQNIYEVSTYRGGYLSFCGGTALSGFPGVVGKQIWCPRWLPDSII